MTVQQIYDSMNSINCDLPCVVARSIKVLSVEPPATKLNEPELPTQGPHISYIVCTFSDGRAITMSLNHQKATIISQAGEFEPDLAHITRNESLCGPYQKESALADYQILSIGTVEPTLRALSYYLMHQEQHSILACCDRPALFYLYGDRLEM